VGPKWGKLRARYEARGDDGSEPARVLAEAIGCSPSCIYYLRKEKGIQARKHQGRKPTVRDAWLAYGDDGSELAEDVAEAIGSSRNYIYQLRSDHGVKGQRHQAWGEYRVRYEALDDDGSEPSRAIAKKVGCSRAYILKLRQEKGIRFTGPRKKHGKYRARWLESGDEGFEPLKVVAERVGCSLEYVSELRKEYGIRRGWAKRCRRCECYGYAEVPIVTPAMEQRLVALLQDGAKPLRPGLCLWCWVELQGYDLRAFHESALWRQVVDLDVIRSIQDVAG